MASTPASHRATNARVLSLLEAAGKIEGDILDLGAGGEYFTELLSAVRDSRRATSRPDDSRPTA